MRKYNPTLTEAESRLIKRYGIYQRWAADAREKGNFYLAASRDAQADACLAEFDALRAERVK